MIEALILLAGLGGAAYLLAPLTRRPGRGGRLLLLLVAGVLGLGGPADAAQGEPSIGLLLIAVDAQRDHLRISEALRLVNPGPPRVVELRVTLPAGAAYLTVHRGMDGLRPAADGFAGRVALARGAREVIYSYALPAGREARVVRSFMLPARRVEIVVRGGRTRLAASRGTALAPLDVGGARLPRWEAYDLAAGDPIEVQLSDLPVSRPWFPRTAAAVFSVLLAGGLAAGARRRDLRPRGEVEESPPVRRT